MSDLWREINPYRKQIQAITKDKNRTAADKRDAISRVQDKLNTLYIRYADRYETLVQ